jgi:hypothetical protein
MIDLSGLNATPAEVALLDQALAEYAREHPEDQPAEFYPEDHDDA